MDESGVTSMSASVPVSKLGTNVEVGMDKSGNFSTAVVQKIGNQLSIGIRAIFNFGENRNKSNQMINDAEENTTQTLQKF
jgi:hypothetical protein